MWDLTVTIDSSLPTYLGDPSYKRRVVQAITDGKPADVSLLPLSAHIGTHVDAPSHLIPGGKTVDALDLSTMVGRVRVVGYDQPGPITAEFLEGTDILSTDERILFKTRNSQFWEKHEFVEDYVGLSLDAADWLVKKGTRLVGIDYLSIDAPGAVDLPVHRSLLINDVVVVENLNLTQVPEGTYQLVCLPMKIGGSEGAPARVILLPE